jgi:hypothetical protein
LRRSKGSLLARDLFAPCATMTQDELLKAPNKAQDVSYVAPGVGVHA